MEFSVISVYITHHKIPISVFKYFFGCYPLVSEKKSDFYYDIFAHGLQKK